MSVILNNSNLNAINLKIKYKNNNGFKNYIFSPSISLKLYNPKISWTNGTAISLCFKKSGIIKDYEIVSNDNYSLLNLLKNINEKLLKLYDDYKEEYGHQQFDHKPTLFDEKTDHFFIRCNLPKNFKPSVGTVFSSVVVDIVNIYEINTTVGMRLSLKFYELDESY